ncbi:DUF6110 family protein [Enterococcus faecalis]|uniref:DUF6110 family protein n=1 Tax=Enterococcus faecalis TaxID=1351 RepID=UPI002FBD9E3F
MFKELKKITKVGKKSSLFIGGVLFGSAGLKLLSSKEAKKSYAHVLAKGFKLKDGLDSSLSMIKQHTDDVYANAKDIYEEERKDENLKDFADASDDIDTNHAEL